MPDRRGNRLIRTGGRFPLRGKTRRARRNRSLATALGVGALGVGLVGLTGAGRYTGPAKSVLGLTGGVPGAYEGHESYSVFHSHRPADRGETRVIRALRGIGSARLFGRRLGFRHDPTQGGEVSGVPLSTRIKVAMRPHVQRRLEEASLWNIAGRGRLLHAIETGSLHAQDAARRVVGKPLHRMGLVAERLLSGQLGRGGRYARKKNRRLAGRIRLLGRRLQPGAESFAERRRLFRLRRDTR